MLVFAPLQPPPPLQTLLNRLNPSAPPALPPPSTFRIHAWRWHHLALESQLSTLSATPLSTPTSSLASAFTFVLAANWDVHDLVESAHLPALTAVPPAVTATRRRLRATREALRADLARGSLSRSDAQRRIRALCLDAHAAFAESERALIPKLANVPRAEQDAFNSRVVRALGQGRARVALTLFYDVLFGARVAGRGCGEGAVNSSSSSSSSSSSRGGEGGFVGVLSGGRRAADYQNRVTAEDRIVFKRAIPGPVRALLPMWQRGLSRTYPILFGSRKPRP